MHYSLIGFMLPYPRREISEFHTYDVRRRCAGKGIYGCLTKEFVTLQGVISVSAPLCDTLRYLSIPKS